MSFPYTEFDKAIWLKSQIMQLEQVHYHASLVPESAAKDANGNPAVDVSQLEATILKLRQELDKVEA